MTLSKAQLGTIAGFFALFLVLHFGCDTKSNEHKAVEKSRAQNFEHISISRILTEATEKLPGNTKTALLQMQQQLQLAETDSSKVQIHKSMASLWYAHNEPLLSGHQAEQIATLVNDAETWNMAGTTYAIARQKSKDELQKQHAQKKSRTALENALSIEPDNIDSKINLALNYVESEAPMQGIMMLKELNEQHPENIPVLMQLGKLSIRSGQYQKAVERLVKVTDLRPTLREAHCLLVDVYAQLGNNELSNKEKALCEIN